MTQTSLLKFADALIHRELDALDDGALDSLNFGVIGIDADNVVQRYNRFESEMAGLSAQRLIGQPMFTVVAPCMNNFLVAQRFEDARNDGSTLDATIDYVLTLRMRPVSVQLRLLVRADAAFGYVLVNRAA